MWILMIEPSSWEEGYKRSVRNLGHLIQFLMIT